MAHINVEIFGSHGNVRMTSLNADNYDGLKAELTRIAPRISCLSAPAENNVVVATPTNIHRLPNCHRKISNG